MQLHATKADSEESLYQRVATILDEARRRVARTVNTEMVLAYWQIGRELVEIEQHGEERAEYGTALIQRVATRLARNYGKGFSLPNLKRMKQFFLAFPQGSAFRRLEEGSLSADQSASVQKGSTVLSLSARFPPSLGWCHYLTLMRVQSDLARSFYEIEAARESWSVRELERQVGSLLFERLAMNRDHAKILELARAGQQVTTPGDVLKDPFVLEFLDLRGIPSAHERDLEQAIIDRLEAFLLEMGKGFCFVARQRRISLEGDHYYIDLVFYNRLLRCFVLLDLKLGKLSHQDLGQMQMYVNYFDRYQRVEHEARTIGIVLCSAKNDAMVKITLPEDNEQVLASRYQMYMPTEDELRAALTRERDEAERVLRAAAG